ncbi:MAG: GntR family transcriptional regulator [Microbacteriaceae bacterium]|nr:GntR family transcriptional regulator [Microbacteriaceae bacterium]
MPIPTQQAIHARSLLRDNVYETIRDAIIDGTLAPGERLRDNELGEWLGTSRTPIREALLRLERAGLVQSKPGKATLVSPIDESATANAQQVVASMHELAARLAVPKLTTIDIDRMRSAAKQFETALDRSDPDSALEADDAFHAVFVEASGNPLVAEVLEQLTPLLRRVEKMRFSSAEARESVNHHSEIITFAKNRDVEQAAKFTRDNWLSLSYAIS